MQKVFVMGTMDTKGREYRYLVDLLWEKGIETLVMNIGLQESPFIKADVTAKEVADLQGYDLEELRRKMSREKMFRVLGEGAVAYVRKFLADDLLNGAIFLGGGQGTLLANMVLRELPIGMPKVLVSTIAGIRIPHFQGIKDTFMLNPQVDIQGGNYILNQELENAANALAGMIQGKRRAQCPSISIFGATMFGITTPCVSQVCRKMEEKGYQVVVFHANGFGGQAMEQFCIEGKIKGVFDITLSEVSNELFGGNCAGGPTRLEVAGALGIPQVVSLGALDTVNFDPQLFPQRYEGRKTLMHNPNVKILRTEGKEMVLIANTIAKKLNQARGPVTLVIPRGGLSENDAPGRPFYDPRSDEILFRTLYETLDLQVVRVVDSPFHICDPLFAELLVDEMGVLINKG